MPLAGSAQFALPAASSGLHPQGSWPSLTDQRSPPAESAVARRVGQAVPRLRCAPARCTRRCDGRRRAERVLSALRRTGACVRRRPPRRPLAPPPSPARVRACVCPSMCACVRACACACVGMRSCVRVIACMCVDPTHECARAPSRSDPVCAALCTKRYAPRARSASACSPRRP